jgi:hypothetical protein
MLDIKKNTREIKINSMSNDEIKKLNERCQELAKELGKFTLLSQGSVMPQPPSAWRWTRKVSGKTVSRGLSAQQADLMKQAIANQRKVDAIIDEMRALSQKIIFALPRTSLARSSEKQPNPRLS